MANVKPLVNPANDILVQTPSPLLLAASDPVQKEPVDFRSYETAIPRRRCFHAVQCVDWLKEETRKYEALFE